MRRFRLLSRRSATAFSSACVRAASASVISLNARAVPAVSATPSSGIRTSQSPAATERAARESRSSGRTTAPRNTVAPNAVKIAIALSARPTSIARGAVGGSHIAATPRESRVAKRTGSQGQPRASSISPRAPAASASARVSSSIGGASPSARATPCPSSRHQRAPGGPSGSSGCSDADRASASAASGHVWSSRVS